MTNNLITGWPTFVLGVLGLAIVSDLHAQKIVPSLEWERLYASEACEFTKVTEASDQSYVLSGRLFQESAPANRSDQSLVKLNSDGSVHWVRIYGGLGNEGGGSFQNTSDGGYIFATASDSAPSGNKDSPHSGFNDVWVVKVDAQGQKQWERSIGGPDQDTPIGIVQSIDGAYMLIVSIGGADYQLVKLSAQGETEWRRPLGGESSGFPQTFIRAADGGYMLAGLSRKTSETDGWVMKLNPEGRKEWEESFEGTGTDMFFSSAITTDGGFILGGSSDSPPSGNEEPPHYGSSDHWLVKVDATGNKEWDRSYSIAPINFNEQVNFILQTSDQGYVFGGNAQLIKTDSKGNQQWDTILEPGNPHLGSFVEIKDLQQTKDGGYILVGNLSIDEAAGLACFTKGWVAKLERVVTYAGEVVTWRRAPGVVLETVETLDGTWSGSQTDLLSVSDTSAITLIPSGKQRFYRLRAAEGSSELPGLSLAALLSWPVERNQMLESSQNKEGSWGEYQGDQGSVGETNYAIVPQNMKQHYFRTRKRQ